MKLHRDVTAEGDKEAPWFESIHLPDDMRIVGITGGNAAEYVNGKSRLLEEKEPQEDKLMEELFRVVSLVTQVMPSQFENQQELLKKHEELLDHFKQSHELENWLQEHQNRAEDRLMKHIQECCAEATLTANSVGHDILRALPELEDRIKEYSWQPSLPTDEVTPQALLKALEIVSRTIWSSVKSE